jgi:protein O-GlcNAc transferase
MTSEELHQAGVAHASRGVYTDAETCLREAILTGPATPLPNLLHDHANILAKLDRLPEAIRQYESALAIAPQYAPLYTDLGLALFRFGQLNAALHCYHNATALDRTQFAAEVGRGDIMRNLMRYDEALSAYDRALSINEHSAEAWRGRGIIVMRAGRYSQAVDAFERAMALDPYLNELLGWHYLAKMSLCDWRGIDTMRARITQMANDGILSTPPFPSLLMPITASQQHDCIKAWAEKFPVPVPLWKGEIYNHSRLRIGYMSSDFRDHAIGHLIAPVLEHHDRSAFEVYGFSLANEPVQSDTARRIVSACDCFLDAYRLPDRKIAELIRTAEIDILIDLNGFTEGMRAYVMASRPAPIQVNYLGFSGTMGIPYIDYIIADETAIPRAMFSGFSESVVWLPYSMMPCDPKRAITKYPRASCGLPESSFVFCAFGNSFKITPEFFAVWMRLLKSVDDSVLWLGDHPAAVVTNLRDEATLLGVNPDRLIFAPRLASHSDHLGRLANADLFLDTLPYNAHATASDALHAGVPVLTCLGKTFAGRIAASQLCAAGLSGVITSTLDEYEREAIALAKEPERAASLKSATRRNRASYPLFDTSTFTRNLELIYGDMKIKGPR